MPDSVNMEANASPADSFRDGSEAVRVLEEKVLAGIEPENASTVQAHLELLYAICVTNWSFGREHAPS